MVCSLSPLSFLWQPDKLWSIAGISLHVTKDSCGLLSFSPLSLSSYGSLISCDLLQRFLYMLVKILSVCSLSPLSLFLWQPYKLWSIAGISLHVSKDSFGLLSLSPLSLSSYGSLISCDLLLGFLYMLLKILSVCSLSPLSFLWQPDKLWSIAGISLHVSKDSFDLLSISSLSLFLWQPDKLWFIAGISLHVTKDSFGLLSISSLSLPMAAW